MVRPFADIPLLDPQGSWTQHWRELQRDRVATMQRIADMQCELVRVRFPGQTVVAANGPEAIYEVLVGQAHRFEKSPVLRTALYPLAGDGLFTSEGALWRRQRKLMSPLFRMRELHAYADAMAACAERGVAGWRDGEVVDVARETTRIAMSVAGKTLFDADTFSDADELGAALTTALDWVNEQVSSPLLVAQARVYTWLMMASQAVPAPLADWCVRAMEAARRPVLLPNERSRQLRAALDVLERRVQRMIADRRAATTPPHDLLTQLLQAADESGERMSDRQVRDEILTLFIAGHETTASGLAWSLYLLAQHPEAYRRAREEADALRGPRVTFDDVKALPFCLRVFKEALRIYPPIYMFGRQALDPVSVAGYALPRGTIVLVSPFVVHHRSDLWPDPERFDPERFTPEAEQARPREAYLPFSGGPRTCIGNHFALLEAPIVLATLLRHADYTLIREVAPQPSATLRPEAGIPMRVALRDLQVLAPAQVG